MYKVPGNYIHPSIVYNNTRTLNIFLSCRPHTEGAYKVPITRDVVPCHIDPDPQYVNKTYPDPGGRTRTLHNPGKKSLKHYFLQNHSNTMSPKYDIR